MKTSLLQMCAAFAAIAALSLPAVADEAKAAGGAGDSVKAAPAELPKGIAKLNGEHWLVKDGQRTKIGKDFTLPSGVKIDAEGRITLGERVPVQLKDRQFVTMEGKVMDAPAALIAGKSSDPEALNPQANVDLAERESGAAPEAEKK